MYPYYRMTDSGAAMPCHKQREAAWKWYDWYRAKRVPAAITTEYSNSGGRYVYHVWIIGKESRGTSNSGNSTEPNSERIERDGRIILEYCNGFERALA